MRRLIIHIGQYKTGSTSIQRSLDAARGQLRGRGVLYPETGLRDGAHFGLAAALREAVRQGAVWDGTALMAEVEASGCDTVIISCEGFSGAGVVEFEPDITLAMLVRLTALFDGWDRRIIWYWRRQDEAVESRIIQTIKGSNASMPMPVAPFLDAREALDFGFFQRVLSEGLPGTAIEPRCFDRAALTGGEVVADFLACAGLPHALAGDQIRRLNATPAASKLAVRMVLNGLGKAGYDVQALIRATFGSPRLGGPQAVLLTPEARVQIMTFYQDSNDRFVAEVVPPDQRAIARAYLARPVSPAQPNLQASADDLAALLIEAGVDLIRRDRDGGPAPLAAPLLAGAGPARGQVRLYFGAHKTASTHVQDLLSFHREAIERAGTRLAMPGDLRGPAGWLAGLYDAVRQRQAGAGMDEALRARLRAPLVEGQDLLLSDENILGTAREVGQRGSFYAFAPPRLAALADLFGDCDPLAFLALRSYDGFFASMYSEVVRNKGYQPFAPFRAGIDAVSPPWSWLPLVAGLVAAFGEERVTLWDFADFAAVQPRLIAALTGMPDAAALIDAFPAQPTRPALSVRTLALLEDLSAAIGTAAAQPLAEPIDARFGTAAGGQPYRPFAPDEAEALRARYRADLAEIRTRWPAIRWLSPVA